MPGLGVGGSFLEDAEESKSALREAVWEGHIETREF